MNYIKIYWLLAMVLTLFSACNERIIVSDADSLGLRYRVKSLDESFYIAYNSFNSIVLQKKLYQYQYKFYNNCNYKSIEKNLFCNKFQCDSILCDSTDKYVVINILNPDSIKNAFPFASKELEYCFVEYKYVSDTVIILEFYDKQGNLKQHIDRKYANNRLLSEEKYSDSGKLISKAGFWYDSKNKLLNKTVFYESGYLETNYAYSTGEKFETDNEFNYRYKFDIDGKVTNKKKYKGTAFISEIHFYYNDYGDIIMTQEIDSHGDLKKTMYDYTYDSKNNWTLCVEYNYTGNIFVRKREITYYS